jgi:serine/threonine protein kinase/tetratricopeptide (TPR) repeat protein
MEKGTNILHYQILEKLGEGGMGVVYKARDTKLNRDVSLKFLPGQAMVEEDGHERFLQEARSIAQINHPNICQIYGIEETNGRQFIVMEFIDGANLHDSFIRERNKKSLTVNETSDEKSEWDNNPFTSLSEQVLNYAIQIAKGLDAAHKKGVIHRDIKPANIMVSTSHEIKILDFGLAKIAGTNQLTRAGSTLGTISYMSPEQIRGEDLDQRSDIWSFGVVLYEMLSGRNPFAGAYEHSAMYSIINTEPPSLNNINEDIPEGLEHVVFRCMSKEADERYFSTADLLNELMSIAGLSASGIRSAAVKTLKAEAAPVSKNRSTLLIASGIVAVLVTIPFLFLFIPGNHTVQNWLSQSGTGSVHLAVLPFTNIGADPGRQVFADGLVETITSQLSQLERYQNDLWVVPAGEIRSLNISSAGEAYQMFRVNYAIAGSLQPIADRLRLTITLIDSRNLRQLNSAVIDVDASDIPALHEKSVESLLAMLNLELNPETIEVISVGKTSVPAAFELYIQGLGYLQRFERLENIQSAIHALEESVVLDNQFALAYAALGQAYWRKFENTRDRTWINLASEQSNRAFQLNNQLLQAHITLGMIATGTGRYREAIQHYNDALAADPTNADAYRGLAEAYEFSGDLDLAESTYKRAIQLKPDYWAGYNVLGAFYFRNNKYEEAKEQFGRVIDLTPDNYRGYMNLGSMYYFSGMLNEAREMYEKSLEIQVTYSAASNLATLYYSEGKFSESVHMYEQALEINDRDYLLWGNLASAYTYAPGKKDEALPAYQKAIDLALEQYDINPGDPELVISLAGYEAVLGNEQRARDYMGEALKLAPDNSYIMYRTGTTHEQLGDRNEALYWIKNAIGKGYPVSEILNQPELTDLISDPRFVEFFENLMD